MCALLGNVAPLHHHHTVRVLNGGQAVCNYQGGAALHQRLQCLLHQTLGFGVECGSRFVQNQHRRVFVQSACNRQALALATRQLHCVVAHLGVNALRHEAHMIGQVGSFQACPHARFIHLGTQGHVRGHGVVEHHHILADHGKLLAQIVQIPVLQRHTIHANFTGCGIDKTRQQVHQGGFARTRWADQGEHFTWVHL